MRVYESTTKLVITCKLEFACFSTTQAGPLPWFAGQFAHARALCTLLLLRVLYCARSLTMVSLGYVYRSSPPDSEYYVNETEDPVVAGAGGRSVQRDPGPDVVRALTSPQASSAGPSSSSVYMHMIPEHSTGVASVYDRPVFRGGAASAKSDGKAGKVGMRVLLCTVIALAFTVVVLICVNIAVLVNVSSSSCDCEGE